MSGYYVMELRRPLINWFLVAATAVVMVAAAVSGASVPAMFVFGDSLVDNGNNNFINSIAKSNYYPYGIDFPGGYTGRFSNGEIFIDTLARYLGVRTPSPYANPITNGTRIFGGVNYASAAAGILDETGKHYGDRFSLNRQVQNFVSTVFQMNRMANRDSVSRYLSKCIVVMVFGSNDYINNYLMPSLYSSSMNYTPQNFAYLLLNHYTRQIVALYSMGLRKFFIPGIGPLGCIPQQLATGQAPPGRCLDQVNQILGTFNEGLRSLVRKLNSGTHPGAIFVYGNTYGVLGDILNTPTNYGLSVVNRACCGIGRNKGQITCLPFAVPCPDRERYLFWDAFHPTQAANAIIARRAFNGSPTDCYPINVQQMVAFNSF